ncbi:triacylglycerol lipase [Pseudonocardia sp. WMMC193]|uniref:esterase/lipase family protein n=1 Tax=Pseudonocardia sp. WMMC193 TaxID=2911965 RepID=UPI001F3631AC|nr:putative lipase [Pseudonocardia sp. WMMC193]MCF7552199.1 putative lipase [Pseudonocardia sp. WMMC193]
MPTDVVGTPVVLVHGWTSDAGGMLGTAQGLDQRLPRGQYTYLRFDWGPGATTWPGLGTKTPQCLADYIVSAWEKGGRRQKVVVVAHSMGGIASRFASTLKSTVNGTPVSDAMSGLVTLSTPHLGSPWGNTGFATFVERWVNRAVPVQPEGMPARECLAAPGFQPKGCEVPPYMPSGITIDEIGTQITIKRTLFGLGPIKLGPSAEISAWGDGIVPADSASGYLASVPGTKPPRVKATLNTVQCNYDTDYLMAAAVGARTPLGVAAATFGNEFLDNAALDDLAAGRPSAATLQIAAYTAFTPCFHTEINPSTSGMPVEPRVLDLTADAVRNARATSAGVPTNRVNLQPVDSTGHAASGWKVTDAALTVDCGYPSPAAVNNAIHVCAPSAAGADACWAEPGERSVLCLPSPWEKTLTRYPATKANFEVEAGPNPSPLGLELVDGSRCRLRNGGSWSGRSDDPNAYGAYSCDNGAGFVVLWGTRGRPDIDMSSTTWTVRKGTADGPLSTVAVRTAYYVATSPAAAASRPPAQAGGTFPSGQWSGRSRTLQLAADGTGTAMYLIHGPAGGCTTGSGSAQPCYYNVKFTLKSGTDPNFTGTITSTWFSEGSTRAPSSDYGTNLPSAGTAMSIRLDHPTDMAYYQDSHGTVDLCGPNPTAPRQSCS